MKNEIQDALQHIDSQRRGFLLKMIAAGAALPVMSTVAFGEPPQFGGNGKGEEGKGGFGGKGKGKGDGGMQMDPAKIAAKLIAEHDNDGDGALNQGELAAALTSLRERRVEGMHGKGGFAGKGKANG